MTELYEAMDFLDGIVEKTKNTIFEPYVPIVVCMVILVLIYKFILVNVVKIIKRLYSGFSKKRFIQNKVYVNLSFMESADVYYAINQFIPTRFSIKNDPGNDDEPAPVYADSGSEKDPLLIEHCIKFEFDIKGGKKYYLCLADCGMGKTTFLINLYYRILQQGKYQCQFITLQESSCLDKIDKIEDKGKTILLLDALDENDEALANYSDFMGKLEQKTREFYRVLITSRTNFFESESKERLSEQQKISGTAAKLPEMRKFYITPFTDEDIKCYLKLRYKYKRKKQERAWKLINSNKNLSVRPLLLRFIDEVLADEQTFEYDFQLYECLFEKWIDREKRNLGEDRCAGIYSECLSMAKAIYYQWMKKGQIGIYIDELAEDNFAFEMKTIQLKGHAMLNRTSDGLYKFSHRSYWEYMLAKLALSDREFANDLLIKNFDRAVSFLHEMIDYYQLHQDKQTPEIVIGIANYTMKYKKPEDAEQQYRKAISLCKEKNQLFLEAMIQLSKCLQRQLKYKSAAEILKECQALMHEVPLEKDTLLLYTQFGMVYAEHCRIHHLKAGQEFLQQIIDFSINNNIINYILLKNYESYCCCCINYYYQQLVVNQMERIMNDYFQGDDQYALYLKNRVLWKTNFRDSNIFGQNKKIIECDKRLMDAYEQMIWHCDLGIFGAAVDAWNDITAKCLENAYNTTYEIYGDVKNEDSSKSNPYITKIFEKTVVACNLLGVGKGKAGRKLEKKCLNDVLRYMAQYNLQEEMSAIHFMLLNYIREDGLGSFSQQKKAMLKSLKIAETSKNDHNIIIANLNLYRLYTAAQNKDQSQGYEFLKRAYELSQNKKNSNFYMTNEYCDLLYLILGFYEDEVEKDLIAQELTEVAPKIYGNDIRRFKIYRELQKYFDSKNNAHEINACLELLRCVFSFYEINTFYDSCMKYYKPNVFLEELHQLCGDKGILSSDEISSLEKFINIRKNEMSIVVSRELDTLLQRNQSLRAKVNTSLLFNME